MRMRVARYGQWGGNEKGVRDEQEWPFDNRCPSYDAGTGSLWAAFRHDLAVIHARVSHPNSNADIRNSDTNRDIHADTNGDANAHPDYNTYQNPISSSYTWRLGVADCFLCLSLHANTFELHR